MTVLLLETSLAGTSVYVNTIRDIIQKSPVVYFSRITAATENLIIGPKGGFSSAGHKYSIFVAKRKIMRSLLLLAHGIMR